MRIVIRADASNRMGIGHLMRCRTLAETLRKDGAQVRFVCREHPGHLIETLIADAFPVVRLPPPPAIENDEEDYALWLGVSQSEDADQTIAALNSERTDWLVVDHYGLDAEWEQALRPHVGRILVVDDLANRNHDCEILLDQNFVTGEANKYRGLLSKNCTILQGTRYALIRHEYLDFRRKRAAHNGTVRRVFVFFGGVDTDNATALALKVLSSPELQYVKVDVVIGNNNPHRSALMALIGQRSETSAYGQQSHLASLMARADLAIGAGGTTTWERMCLGVPSLVISIAENQRRSCVALSKAGLIDFVGDIQEVNEQILHEHLQQLVSDPEKLIYMSKTGHREVDGLGCDRICQAILTYPGR